MKVDKILEILERARGFEWDKGNSQKNWIRHKVRDKECEEIFFNRPLFVNFDEKHSAKEEKRFQALGKTNRERKLFVVFTIRKNRIRVISARDQNKEERRQYEKT